jgi:hypothetical protein
LVRLQSFGHVGKLEAVVLDCPWQATILITFAAFGGKRSPLIKVETDLRSSAANKKGLRCLATCARVVTNAPAKSDVSAFVRGNTTHHPAKIYCSKTSVRGHQLVEIAFVCSPCRCSRMVRNSFAPIAGERHRFSAEARRALSHVIMLEQATWIAFQED